MELNQIRASLKATRNELLPLFDAPENVLVKRYAPGKWTIHELLCHLADAESVYLWRVCRAMAEPGAPVEGFDQDRWATGLNYPGRSLEAARQLFEGTRGQLLSYLERLQPELLAHTVTHSERGPLTLEQLIATVASHTEHHLTQIRAAKEGRTWEPAP
ncbi:MAG: DinB family protein [Candidatus Hydrogenedentes bacterium]|nr:DinB family protein [Candidatus Hydrogenedentota bacterium]